MRKGYALAQFISPTLWAEYLGIFPLSAQRPSASAKQCSTKYNRFCRGKCLAMPARFARQEITVDISLQSLTLCARSIARAFPYAEKRELPAGRACAHCSSVAVCPDVWTKSNLKYLLPSNTPANTHTAIRTRIPITNKNFFNAISSLMPHFPAFKLRYNGKRANAFPRLRFPKLLLSGFAPSSFWSSASSSLSS